MGGSRDGLVFNVQRFSLHDGTGIRTLVFLKGCPLRCIWCSNPEGQGPRTEIRYDRNACIGCAACAAACRKGAVSSADGTSFSIDRSRCVSCFDCVKVCPGCAKFACGDVMTVEDVMDIVRKDALFYRHSGGGITLSGGEVLSQPEFACEVLRRCKDLGLNTAVETSGYGDRCWLDKIAALCDTVFFDLKVIDRQRHLELTGVDNSRILANLLALDCSMGSGSASLVVRIPVIPTLNGDPETVEDLGRFVRELEHVSRVELLPFHNFGEQKYRELGMRYSLQGSTAADVDTVKPLQKIISALGVPCSILTW